MKPTNNKHQIKEESEVFLKGTILGGILWMLYPWTENHKS